MAWSGDRQGMVGRADGGMVGRCERSPAVSDLKMELSNEEIDALRQYVQEGHNVIGTYILFQFNIDNQPLAALIA